MFVKLSQGVKSYIGLAPGRARPQLKEVGRLHQTNWLDTTATNKLLPDFTPGANPINFNTP